VVSGEGHGRWHYQENIHYCRISRGSLDELIDDFNICEDERYCDQTLVAQLKTEAYSLTHRINGYIVYLKRTKQGGADP
jgi:four helix bundle protein